MYTQILIASVYFLLICVLSTNGIYCDKETPMEVLYTSIYTFFPIKSERLIYFTVQTNGSAKILLRSSPKYIIDGKLYYYEICIGCKVDNEIRTELKKNGRTKISVASKALSTSEITSFYIAWHRETNAILVGRDKVISFIWYDTEDLGLLPFNYFGIRSDPLSWREGEEFSKWTFRLVEGKKEIAALLNQQMNTKKPKPFNSFIRTDFPLPEFEKPELSMNPITHETHRNYMAEEFSRDSVEKQVNDDSAEKAKEKNESPQEL